MTVAIMDIKKLMQLIPHRYPMLLIDKVIDLNNGESITAIKNVTINENFFNGHFPTEPVMPGVLLIEALAQAAGIMIALANNIKDSGVYLTSIDKAKFRKPVIPGDVVFLKAQIKSSRVLPEKSIWKIGGHAEVEGKIAAESNLTITIMLKNTIS